jgi:SNF2 family DNA or RNA helicase
MYFHFVFLSFFITFLTLSLTHSLTCKRMLSVPLSHTLPHPFPPIHRASRYSIGLSQAEDRRLMKKLNIYCLVLDEGHMLRNMKTQRYTSLMAVPARHRVLLTGTPIQNNLVELLSLLTFVMPSLFLDAQKGFTRLFGAK